MPNDTKPVVAQSRIDDFLSSLTVADHLGDVWDAALAYLPGAEEHYDEYLRYLNGDYDDE